jgi:hypothetical protein
MKILALCHRHSTLRTLTALTWLFAGTSLAAQGARPAGPRVKLSQVISAFLVDSGVRTRGLPWTTGDALPIKWQSAGPVATDQEWLKRKGLTHLRSGTFIGTAGDSVALSMEISLTGTAAGLAGMSVHMPSMAVTKADKSGFFTTRQMIEDALRNEGMTFAPIKCKRETEGASYGNLIDAVKAPGKTASGLWWFWQSPQQEFQLTIGLLYRRADMDEVECYSG